MAEGFVRNRFRLVRFADGLRDCKWFLVRFYRIIKDQSLNLMKVILLVLLIILLLVYLIVLRSFFFYNLLCFGAMFEYIS